MITLLYFIGIYLIGFLITLTFLKFFGKRIGLDFEDVPLSARWPDDWDDNAEAYFGFSMLWPITVSVGLLLGSFKILSKFSEWYLKL